jgi:Uma2 family endonuclease
MRLHNAFSKIILYCTQEQMMSTAIKMKTLEDFLALHEDSRAELIDGQIVYKAMPSGRHASVEGAINRTIGQAYHRKSRKDGTGGWWILPEISIHYRRFERILTADLAGWRRESLIQCPTAYPVPDCPDWVCEVAHTTLKKDTTVVFETLQKEGVPFYWIANTENGHLQVFELIAGRYVMAQSFFQDDGYQRIKPFDAVELNVAMLFGADSPDDVEEE